MKNTNMFNYEDDQSDEPGDSKKSNTKVLRKFLLWALLISGGAFLGMHFSKNAPSDIKNLSTSSNNQEKNVREKYFFDLGEIIVNLSNKSLKNYFLKVDLEVNLNNPDDKKIIESQLPIIKDSFQVFLREMRIEDIRGTKGAFYIKSELLKRLNAIIYPVKAENLLIKEIIVN
jgi:flagellar FliL protein